MSLARLPIATPRARRLRGAALLAGAALAALPALAAAEITVLTAWYGQSCGTSHGNVTAHVQSRCNGRRTCSYPVHVDALGDPAPGCSKNFVVLYACKGQAPVRLSQIPAEAHGRTVELNCTGSGAL
ncbi:MAG: hypothetical protein RL456_3010 [Pseudomonadota bacterium]|jgi:hypothetical protein